MWAVVFLILSYVEGRLASSQSCEGHFIRVAVIANQIVSLLELVQDRRRLTRSRAPEQRKGPVRKKPSCCLGNCRGVR